MSQLLTDDEKDKAWVVREVLGKQGQCFSKKACTFFFFVIFQGVLGIKMISGWSNLVVRKK